MEQGNWCRPNIIWLHDKSPEDFIFLLLVLVLQSAIKAIKMMNSMRIFKQKPMSVNCLSNNYNKKFATKSSGSMFAVN